MEQDDLNTNLRGALSQSAYVRAGYGMDAETADDDDNESILGSVRRMARGPRAAAAPAPAPGDIPQGIWAAFQRAAGGQGVHSAAPAPAPVVSPIFDAQTAQNGEDATSSAEQAKNKALFEAALRAQQSAGNLQLKLPVQQKALMSQTADVSAGEQQAASAPASPAPTSGGDTAEVKALKAQVHMLAEEVTELMKEGRHWEERDHAVHHSVQVAAHHAPSLVREPARRVAGEDVARREWFARRESEVRAAREDAQRGEALSTRVEQTHCTAPDCVCVPDGAGQRVALSGKFSITSIDGVGPQASCRFFTVEGPTGHRLSLLLQGHGAHWGEYGAVSTGCLSRAATERPGTTLLATDLMTGDAASFGLACKSPAGQT